MVWYVRSIFALAIFAGAALGQGTRLANPFYAFGNCLEGTPETMAATLGDLGYAGLDWDGSLGAVPQVEQALKARGLSLLSVFRYAQENIPGNVQALRGKPTLITVAIGEGHFADDAAAVAWLRPLAASADSAGLTVVLYPHVDSFLDRAEDAVRICRKVDRKNVRMAFNLCHFLMDCHRNRLDPRVRLAPVLEESLPWLASVSINGADDSGTTWSRLIKPLGQGSYPVAGFLRLAVDKGFRGPVGLQCYAVPGNKAENLKASMAAWRSYQAALVPASIRWIRHGEVTHPGTLPGRYPLAGFLADAAGRRLPPSFPGP